LSALGKLFELQQLPLKGRKQLYEEFLKIYSEPKTKNKFKEIRAQVWQKSKNKETLARFAMLVSKISISGRIKSGFSELDVYEPISNLVQEREFINGIGKTGEPISSTVIKDLKKAVSPYTSSWRGQGHSHTGGARASTWLETIAEFVEKKDYDLIKWINSFDCPSKTITDLKKIKFSSRDSAKFLALVGHPKLNAPEIPVCVSHWYPKHARCFPPRITDEVAKFFFRTGCITVKSTEEYYDVPEKGFDVQSKEFVGVSYPIFYGPIFDELKKASDPSLLSERIIDFCSDSFQGICSDDMPQCQDCRINEICSLSKMKGKNPEIVKATSDTTDFYSGRSKPKTSISCLLK
jgi:hypothetical protein